MRAQKSGCILVVSSVAAVLPIPFQGLYSAAKAALNALAAALANEVRPYHIRVAALMPVSYTHLDVYKRQTSSGAGKA